MKEIKVAFIVQMPEIWDKEADIYESMCKADDFDPYLISVPKYNISIGKTNQSYGIEDKFFSEKYPDFKILRLNQFKSFIIENYNFDYVFYQRPYDHMLPACLQSAYVSSKTKVCYVPYATFEQQTTGTLPPDFFKNVLFAFMAESDSVQRLNDYFKDRKTHHFLNVGYPIFEHLLSLNHTDNGYSSVLWAPRWSYHPFRGGSHFFEYKELFESYRRNVNHLTVRPHPLMWENFQKENLISKEEIKLVHDRWRVLDIEEDTNPSFLPEFEKADILVSDPSSIIALYLLTGKPIVFCPKEPYNYNELSDLMKTIFPGLYIARSEEELISVLDMLTQRKDDPLKPIRNQIIEENFLYNYGATEHILDELRNDCSESVS